VLVAPKDPPQYNSCFFTRSYLPSHNAQESSQQHLNVSKSDIHSGSLSYIQGTSEGTHEV
jgi:hypothetical protein